MIVSAGSYLVKRALWCWMHRSSKTKLCNYKSRTLRVGKGRVSVPYPQYLGQGLSARELQVEKVEKHSLQLQRTGQCRGQQNQETFIKQHVS